MRILIYTTEFPPYSGGVSSFCHSAATGLARCGAEVHLVAPSYGPTDVGVDQNVTFTVDRMPDSCRSGSEVRRHFLKAFRRFRPDVCFLANGKATRHIARLGRLPCAIAIYLHGNEIPKHFGDPRSNCCSQPRADVKRLFRDAECILSVCRATADLFEAYYEQHGRHSEVVHLGIDLDRFRFTTVESPAPPPNNKRHIVLCVARLAPEKGHDVLLRAFDSVRRCIPGATLRIAGDGPCRDVLEELSEALCLTEHVQFLGNLAPDRLSEEYRGCDLFAMVSRQEAFPTVFLEAGAFGKPVVAGRTGGVGEVVQDGVTGFLVDPCDSAAIARVITVLLNDTTQARAIGERGRQRVLSEFTHLKLGERLINTLEPHVGSPRTRVRATLWATRELTKLSLRRAISRTLAPLRHRKRTNHFLSSLTPDS